MIVIIFQDLKTLINSLFIESTFLKTALFYVSLDDDVISNKFKENKRKTISKNRKFQKKKVNYKRKKHFLNSFKKQNLLLVVSF